MNEFHTLNGECSLLVPSGPGYSNVTLANQVCTTVGAVSGQSTVNGNTFVELSYGYSYGNLWRNFGIVCAFMAAFLCGLLAFTEFNQSSALDISSVMYIRGGKKVLEQEKAGDDEEKVAPIQRSETATERETQEKALAGLQTTPDIFSWQDIEYTVPIGKRETRKLLDKVSGFVSPGKLTALMGESGAGKVSYLLFLSISSVLSFSFISGETSWKDIHVHTSRIVSRRVSRT